MLLNDMYEDITLLCKNNETSKSDIARELGKSRQTVSNILRAKGVITRSYVEMLEILGYDIELKYVKRLK